MTLGGLGILVAVGIWLFPIHYAWNLSSIGFANLSTQEVTKEPQQKSKLIDAFVENLTKSHQLAPWEPYYSYQLGWNLGDLGLQTNDPAQSDWEISQNTLGLQVLELAAGKTISPQAIMVRSQLG